MNDSNPDVNSTDDGFELLIRGPANPSNVSRNRDDVVSKFVRMRIREWRDSGRELQELARLAKVAKSTPSQVLLGTGVAGKTGPRFAIAFDYPSFDAMRAAAWEWWKRQEHVDETAALAMTEAMREAEESVLKLGQGTKEQIETIMLAYNHPRFRDREADWWIQTLLAELALDRAALREDKHTRDEVHSRQREVRELQGRKKRASERRQKSAAPQTKRAVG